jgi:ribosomal protein S16
MEGKTSTIVSLTGEQNKEGMYINKLGVYNPINCVNNNPLLRYCKDNG